MPWVGIRELKNSASRIIRAVREDRAEYVITHHGQPVAVILPVDEAARTRLEERMLDEAREHSDCWARLDALAEEIDAAWSGDKSAVEQIEEDRRDL